MNNSFDTIDLLDGSVFQVTWDLGRRCNYDCSYCPDHRHDNFSPHASLETLTNNVDFLYKYIDLYMDYRFYKETNIGFTGGEPTVNPNFIPFIQYLKKAYKEKYEDKWRAGFALTSNGAMSSKTANAVMKHFDHITVSYHTEAKDSIKKRVIDRIEQFHNHGPDHNFTISINVMFHAAYFEECQRLCDYFDSKGIKYVPRVIGEEPGSRSNFAHQYTEKQIVWMKDYWKNNTKKVNDPSPEEIKQNTDFGTSAATSDNSTPQSKQVGYSIGRPCCGSRTMCLSNNDSSRKSKFVDFREFKGWNCSVNWFFMHIEQQTDSVFHHQTCQAMFGNKRGPIGRLSESDKILEELEKNLKNRTMPTIVCPKHTCGCGLCAPKSKNIESYKKVLFNHVDKIVFANSGDINRVS